jgi:hypothetical protein
VASPAIAGTADVGSTVVTTSGTWKGTPVPAYAYQWQDCAVGGGSCADIAGATSSAYVVASTDSGHRLRVLVTASN